MKSEIVSTSYSAPYLQQEQSIIEFISKTQSDYMSKKVRISFLVPNSLNPNEVAFDKEAFDDTYLMIHKVAEYCKDNGMVFEEPKFYNDEQLKVIIYDDKKYKKEQDKEKSTSMFKIFDIFFDKISPKNEIGNEKNNQIDDETVADDSHLSDNDQTHHNNDEDNDKKERNVDIANMPYDDVEYDEIESDDETQLTQTSTDNIQTLNTQTKHKSLQFDERLSECIKIQIEQISSRLIKFNKTAEESGIRSVCKLNKISIRPIDNSSETLVDTIGQLRNFLTFYAGEKRKVIYLKQVISQISPVLTHYFNVDEVLIIPDLEPEIKQPETINPFANLIGKNRETKTLTIDERWQVNLVVSYFDQEFDIMSEQFKNNKLSESDVLNLDMQLSIQDHLHQGKNTRMITAPSYDFIIGRSDDADVQIFGDESAGQPKFSRQHLRVQKKGNQWIVSCISKVPVLIDGADLMTLNDSKVIKKTMSARLVTRKGIAVGEYGIYPEITFHVASRKFAVEITDPGAFD